MRIRITKADGKTMEVERVEEMVQPSGTMIVRWLPLANGKQSSLFYDDAKFQAILASMKTSGATVEEI